MSEALYLNATCVAVGGRGLLIEGPPGSGKSSLALALIDRGAVLVGDDGVSLALRDARLFASPPPRNAGKLEVRNLGLLDFPTASDVPLSLAIRLDENAERWVEQSQTFALHGAELPLIGLWPRSPVLARRAELALDTYSL